MDRILASSAFSNASHSQQFLRFAIQETLAGRASDLKEPVVATRVPGEPSRAKAVVQPAF